MKRNEVPATGRYSPVLLPDLPDTSPGKVNGGSTGENIGAGGSPGGVVL